MPDLYTQIANNRFTGRLVGSVGLPQPVPLERWEPGTLVIRGEVLLGAAPGGRLAGPIAKVLATIGADVRTALRDDLRSACADAGLDAKVFNAETASDERFKALVFDATGIQSSEELRELWAFFSPTLRRVRPNGRVIVLGTPPDAASTPREATAQRALEGFTRSVGKEARKAIAVQLVHVAPGGEGELDSTLRFLLSPRSAYVSGQVVRVAASPLSADIDPERPLDGRIALVTGASRGIGESIARTLARDGAHVIGLDVPALERELEQLMTELGGSRIVLDITAPDAPEQICAAVRDPHGGLDALIHNAGVTRDKTLGRMSDEQWSGLIDINLTSQERIDEALLDADLLRPAARIVCLSSMNGIAGQSGQTNYATSKAGVIGRVTAMAPILAERQATINAVAPGFIETQMTAKMPIPIREAGRRMNSMSQGGLPIDVAETVAWLASPASGGVSGNTIRICGQSLLGA